MLFGWPFASNRTTTYFFGVAWNWISGGSYKLNRQLRDRRNLQLICSWISSFKMPRLVKRWEWWDNLGSTRFHQAHWSPQISCRDSASTPATWATPATGPCPSQCRTMSRRLSSCSTKLLLSSHRCTSSLGHMDSCRRTDSGWKCHRHKLQLMKMRNPRKWQNSMTQRRCSINDRWVKLLRRNIHATICKQQTNQGRSMTQPAIISRIQQLHTQASLSNPHPRTNVVDQPDLVLVQDVTHWAALHFVPVRNLP